MKKKQLKIIGMAVIISVAVIAGFLTTIRTDTTQISATGTEGVIETPKGEEPIHFFEGKINNVAVEPGTFEGKGVYDRNCIPVDPNNPHGEVTCDAGIQTNEHGEILNFHYQHDMNIRPCIAPGEPVEIQVMDQEGTAEVRRFERGG